MNNNDLVLPCEYIKAYSYDDGDNIFVPEKNLTILNHETVYRSDGEFSSEKAGRAMDDYLRECNRGRGVFSQKEAERIYQEAKKADTIEIQLPYAQVEKIDHLLQRKIELEKEQAEITQQIADLSSQLFNP